MADDKTPPQDPFEMFRRLWGPLGVPVPGMAMPTLDPAEVEKRISTHAATSPLRVLVTSFVVLFTAEWGDLSQLLTAGLAARTMKTT